MDADSKRTWMYLQRPLKFLTDSKIVELQAI